MRLRPFALTLAAGFSVLPAVAQTRPVNLPARKPMRAYALEVNRQWGADISPEGSTVALAFLRKNYSGGYDDYVEAELWDFRAKRRLAQRTLAHRPNITVTTAEWGQVRYTSDGQALLVYDGELLHVLRPATLEEITRIDLGLEARPREADIVDMAPPRRARGLAAVLISRGRGRGGSVRVYDLQSGAMRHAWDFERGYPEYGGHLAWHPDGRRLAVTLLPVLPGQKLPAGETSLEVLDAESGKLLLKIHTGYLVGPVAFTPDNHLLTVTTNMAWTLPSGPHSIQMWDASTGKLIREISGAPNGVRGSLELSANGKRLVGYVGKERSDGTAPDPEGTLGIFEQQFRLWDLPTGRVLVTSPSILPNPFKRPELRLNATGTAVLLYWRVPDQPVLVYEVP